MITGRAIATGSAIPSLAWLAYLNPSVALGLAALLAALFVGLLSLLFCRSAEPHRRLIELIRVFRKDPGSTGADPGSTPCVGCSSAT